MALRTYKTVYQFLWHVIKPYKWHYLVMISVPILSAFYDFANNYSLKLVIDIFTQNNTANYSDFLYPILLFIGAQICLDVLWRIGDIAEWCSEPYVRKAILEEVFFYTQHHSPEFFKDTPSGSITSRVKGILDGYDHFWANMHHDFSSKVANAVILTLMLSIVNTKISLLIALWGIIFFITMYSLSKKMDSLSAKNAEDRHKIWHHWRQYQQYFYRIFFCYKKI